MAEIREGEKVNKLATVSQFDRMLSGVKTTKDAHRLSKLAESMAHAIRQANGNATEWVYRCILAKRKLGFMLGPPPGKGKGGGRGKKLLGTSNSFSGVEIHEARKLAYGIAEAALEAYYRTFVEERTKHLSVREVLALAKIPKPKQERAVETIKSGKASNPAAAKKAIDADEAEENLDAAVEEIGKSVFSDVCDLRHCSMAELLKSQPTVDAIITDPPYPEKFLPLYEELAKLSANVPCVAVMCGQSYLPEIMQAMCQHLKYRWTIAYLTPGGQAVQQWQAKVNTFWKPILLFGKSHGWFGDVCGSDVNENDKRYHDWGQSESGMASIIDRITNPGQTICDPFLGGGTTAVIALRMGRKFVGCDIDAECVAKAKDRVHDELGRAKS